MPVFVRNSKLDVLKYDGGENIKLGIGMCEDSGMRATGIPTNIGLVMEIKELTKEIEELRSTINVGNARLRDELPELISGDVERRIRASFHIEGVIPLTTIDLERSIGNLRTDFQTMIENSQQSIMHNINEINPINNNINDYSRNSWGVWKWNDGLMAHYVPPNWNFPRGITLKALWDLWFLVMQMRISVPID